MKEIHKNNPLYPRNLLEVADAPERIFIEGKPVKRDILAVAIVGTRTPTKYGIEMAQKFAAELTKAGITIVSGLARGIDTIAHKTALKTGGRTIAVVANGLDIIYPPENHGLAEEIVCNGYIISEFDKGVHPLPTNFLARNRIVSGISKAIIVIEGRRRSGTLSTASHAANQGREVFAVPGPINSKLSEAPNYLIEQGANIAKSAQDIIDILG